VALEYNGLLVLEPTTVVVEAVQATLQALVQEVVLEVVALATV